MSENVIHIILQKLRSTPQGDIIDGNDLKKIKTSQEEIFETTLCHLNVLRISAPNPPYSNEEIEVVMEKVNECIQEYTKEKKSEMIEMIEIIESTKMMLLLIDINKQKTLRIVESLIEKIIKGTAKNEFPVKYEMVKKIIEDLLTECPEESREIVKSIIRPFNENDAPFLEEKKITQYLKKSKMEKEVIEEMFEGMMGESNKNFKNGFWSLIEEAKEINEEDEAMSEDEELEDRKKKEDIKMFIRVLGKIVSYYPKWIEGDENYLERILLIPMEEERIQVVKIVVEYLKKGVIEKTKKNELIGCLLERRKDKSVSIRSIVGKYMMERGGKNEESEEDGIEISDLIIEKMNDIEESIRRETIEEIYKQRFEEGKEIGKKIIKEIKERMKDRKETVRAIAQTFCGEYIREYIEQKSGSNKDFSSQMINEMIENMENIKNEEDNIRIYQIISQNILGNITLTMVNSKSKLKETIKERAERLIKLFGLLDEENFKKMMKKEGVNETEKKELGKKLEEYENSREEGRIKEVVVNILSKMYPMPTIETSKKYAREMLEGMSGKFGRMLRDMEEDETSFSEYWKKAKRIDGEVEIKKKGKIEEFVNGILEKIRNKIVQKEMIKYLIKTHEEEMKEYMEIISKYCKEVNYGNIMRIIKMYEDDIEKKVNVMKEGYLYIEKEEKNEEMKEEIKAYLKMKEYTISKGCMKLLHLLWNDQEEGYYDMLFEENIKNVLKKKGKKAMNGLLIVTKIIKYKKEYNRKKEITEINERIKSEIIPGMIIEKEPPEHIIIVMKYIVKYLQSKGKIVESDNDESEEKEMMKFIKDFIIHKTDNDTIEFRKNEEEVRGYLIGVVLKLVEMRKYDSLINQREFYSICEEISKKETFCGEYLEILNKCLKQLPLRYFIIPTILSKNNKAIRMSKIVLLRSILIRREIYKKNIKDMTQEKTCIVLPEYCVQHLIHFLGYGEMVENGEYDEISRMLTFMIESLVEGNNEGIPIIQNEINLIKLSNDNLNNNLGITEINQERLNEKIHGVALIGGMVIDEVSRGKKYSPNQTVGTISKMLFELREKNESINSILPYGYHLPKRANAIMTVGEKKKKKENQDIEKEVKQVKEQKEKKPRAKKQKKEVKEIKTVKEKFVKQEQKKIN
ncbi:hypothetical protein ENUP19_0036G0050 [Entamoeba nuttalli]|uniref:Uncharacterized protein n=2 Tax=Entamoeba nuttalli TaxID=412467 RepID=A0ABQ0D9D3_9EUKA